MTSLTARQPRAASAAGEMIDYFALGLTHALMALAAWRLMARADLDREDGEGDDGKRRRQRPRHEAEAGDA